MSKIYDGICPCKDCSKRQVGCHTKCDDYKGWQATGVEVEKKPYVNMAKYKRRSTKIWKKPL